MALSIDSILKLSTQKKVLILVAILCVIVGLYLYAFFLPQQESLKVARVELTRLAKELNESKAITRDLQKFKEQVQKLDEELKTALTQLPNESEIPEILKNISSLAFVGADRRTVVLGCLLGDSLACFASPVAGLPPVHWDY